MKSLSSCLDCAMLHECHRTVQPGRDLARSIAASCELPARGRTTDVLKVIGRDHGISRKRAVRLARGGLIRWLDASTVLFISDTLPAERAYQKIARD